MVSSKSKNAKQANQMMLHKEARRLVHYLNKNKHKISPMLVMVHDFPDPDAIASAFAFKYAAEQVYHINCKIVYGGAIGREENRGMVEILKIPMYQVNPRDFRKYAQFTLVDTQPGFANNNPNRKRIHGLNAPR